MPSEKSALSMRWLARLIPIGVLILVLAIGVPAILQSRETARRLQSKNNLKQFALGLHNYHDVFLSLPPGGTFDAEGRAHHSWNTFLEPWLASDPWYSFVNFNVPWDDPENVGVFLHDSYGRASMQNPSVLETRSPDGFRLTHYSVNQVLMHRNSSARLSDITSGLRSTLLIGEATGEFLPAGYPYNWRDASLGLGRSAHGFGCGDRNSTVVTMADASAKELNNNADLQVFLRMAGPGDLQPAADLVAKPDRPYQLKTSEYWKFDWCSRGDKSECTFRTSPDGKTLLITLGETALNHPHRDLWVERARRQAESSALETVKILGNLNAAQLRPFLKLPHLKRLDLSQAYVDGGVESILTEAPPSVVLER